MAGLFKKRSWHNQCHKDARLAKFSPLGMQCSRSMTLGGQYVSINQDLSTKCHVNLRCNDGHKITALSLIEFHQNTSPPVLGHKWASGDLSDPSCRQRAIKLIRECSCVTADYCSQSSRCPRGFPRRPTHKSNSALWQVQFIKKFHLGI